MVRTTAVAVVAGVVAGGLIPLVPARTRQEAPASDRAFVAADPPAPAPEKPIEVAPPPREDTRITRKALDVGAVGRKSEYNTSAGVEWVVEVGVRRLPSGADAIDIDWTIKYFGPRPPLHILRPSLTTGWPDATVALVSAVPKGKEDGREVRFTAPDYDAATFWRIFQEAVPDSFYFLAEGREASGTETIHVPELKRLLQSRYPDEYPQGCPPPSLYVDFKHKATDRGGHHDCWTGELICDTLNVPDLKDW